VFFFVLCNFCEVVGLLIIHKKDLAKFDSALKRMVEKFGNHATHWLHATIYV
jgi:hypothetical protein